MLFKVANVITGAGGNAAKQDEGASLTSVLETPALRIELALLVLLCTDAMRSDLTATFDPNKTHESTSSTVTPPPNSPQPQTATQDLISFDEPPPDEAALDAERAKIARQREVESTQMQGLKRGALTFFDKWRAGVMHRICDVLCVRSDVVRSAKAKRRRMMDESERQKQGNSLLLDFEGDPFSSQAYTGRGKRKHGHYEVIETQILAFEHEKKTLILHCLLLLLLSLEYYPAHSRVLLLQLASSLELETDLLVEHEKSVAQGLLATAASKWMRKNPPKNKLPTTQHHGNGKSALLPLVVLSLLVLPEVLRRLCLQLVLVQSWEGWVSVSCLLILEHLQAALFSLALSLALTVQK